MILLFKNTVAGKNVNEAKSYLTLWNREKKTVEFIIGDETRLQPHFSKPN
jgi:hypothetical protein